MTADRRAIHHLALRTRDPGRLVVFYRDLLGLAELEAPGRRGRWLAAGDAVLMIERADPAEPAIPAGSRELLAFHVSATEREALVRRLRAAGVPLEHRTEHTAYIRDPDGRRVGLSSYPLPRPAG